MKHEINYWYSKESQKLQMSYDDYAALIEKRDEFKRLQSVSQSVVADLKQILDGGTKNEPEGLTEKGSDPETEVRGTISSEAEQQDTKRVSVEFSAGDPEPVAQRPSSNVRSEISDVPPIKNEIAGHFNKLDESGRLFSIFKQYYTCLNDACGGTVRVTMKDGFCSLWNYDAWEEFAFVDIFEGQLRIALDPSHTDELKALSLCEVPRLIASRRNVICVLVADLNNTVLDVLARAFSEVATKVS